MPSYSDHNKFPIPSDGESGWATVMNTFLQITLEEALGGYTTQAVAGVNLSLTMASNSTSVKTQFYQAHRNSGRNKNNHLSQH